MIVLAKVFLGKALFYYILVSFSQAKYKTTASSSSSTTMEKANFVSVEKIEVNEL